MAAPSRAEPHRHPAAMRRSGAFGASVRGENSPPEPPPSRASLQLSTATMPVDVVFIEPSFPANQREFVRALHAVGARVIGIGERPKDGLDPELRHWLF